LRTDLFVTEKGWSVEFLVVWGRSEAIASPAHANTHICLQNGDLINFLLRKEKKPKDIQIHLSTKL
jgi:hypothetical protein